MIPNKHEEEGIFAEFRMLVGLRERSEAIRSIITNYDRRFKWIKI